MFVNGVMPGGEVESAQVLVEADGTWIRLQGVKEGEPERVEVKALVAYGEKVEEGKKVRRSNAVHHGCVATPDSFWTQGVAAIGTRFDLSKIETCHLGTDGEGWCKRGAEFLPSRVSTTGHLDVFHVNHAVLSCFGKENAKGAWHVLDVLAEGDKEEACCLLEAMAGLARPARILVTSIRATFCTVSEDGDAGESGVPINTVNIWRSPMGVTKDNSLSYKDFRSSCICWPRAFTD